MFLLCIEYLGLNYCIVWRSSQFLICYVTSDSSLFTCVKEDSQRIWMDITIFNDLTIPHNLVSSSPVPLKMVHAWGLQIDVVYLSLTNIAPPYESKCGGRRGVAGAYEFSCAHHVTWSPNKLWRSTSIFNLLFMLAGGPTRKDVPCRSLSGATPRRAGVPPWLPWSLHAAPPPLEQARRGAHWLHRPLRAPPPPPD